MHGFTSKDAALQPPRRPNTNYHLLPVLDNATVQHFAAGCKVEDSPCLQDAFIASLESTSVRPSLINKIWILCHTALALLSATIRRRTSPCRVPTAPAGARQGEVRLRIVAER